MRKIVEKEKLFVSVGGFYYTGSGAVVDLLKEYDGLNVLDGEIRMFKADLMRMIKNIAEGSTTSEEEVKDLKERLFRHAKKRSKLGTLAYEGLKRIPIFPKQRKLFLKQLEEDYVTVLPRYKESIYKLFENLENLNSDGVAVPVSTLERVFRQYFEDLFSDIDGVPVLDQFIRPNDPLIPKIMPYGRIILVTRDPRDQFCDIVSRRTGRAKFHGSNRVETFIESCRKRYAKGEVFFKNSPDNILRIQFEDLLYKYDETKGEIEEFLNLEGKHKLPLKYFKPQESILNTKLFEKHSNKKEIELIEKELKNWIYPFV